MISPARRLSKSALSLRLSGRLGAIGLLAGLAPLAPAFAKDDAVVADTTLRVFQPGYFASFAPQSALDMVAQTPGFSIKEGEGRRGMGSGGSNVLIDRRQIPSKSMSAREALGRIGAGDVVRIEILDATQLGLPGLSGQVVNVVTRPSAMSARWEWSPEVDVGEDPQLTRGRLLVSGKTDEWQYNLGLSTFEWAGRSRGPETLFDGLGRAVEFRDEVDRNEGSHHEFSGALNRESPGGDVSNLALVLATGEDQRDEVSFRTGEVSDDHLRTFTLANERDSLKLTGDHEFALGGGRLKLIGLRTSFSSAPVTATLDQLVGAAAPNEGAQAKVNRESGESILRGEYSWADDGGDWQMALEGAVNTLDSTTTVATLNDGLFVDAPLSGGAAHVEETRTEAAIVHARALGDGVFMQASLAAEYSQLAQSGPDGKEREFVRPKGFVSLSWTPVTDWNASVKVERSVGQLDFGDFISSVNLSDESGQQQSGNPEIVPEQSWDLALEANGAMGRLGAVRVKVFGRQIEDVNGSVLFARSVDADGNVSISEGPGNLDSARTYGVDLSGTMPMAGMGIPGAKIDWSASVRDSSITDPVTGEDRQMSGSRLSHYELRFRQDLPGTPWAWGVGYETGHNAAGNGVTQVTYRDDAPGRLGAFVQHKDIAGMNARLSVSNLADTGEHFVRVAHGGTVADPVAFIEDRTREQALHVGLNLSGSF